VISKKTKNGEALVKKFNAGLAQLRKSGRYDEILRYWYNKPIYKDAMPEDCMKQIRAANLKNHKG
jgi:polar amino acid transport system substrate-binding protein